MNELPQGAAASSKKRRWFVVLAVVTLVGFALFVGAITVMTMKIPYFQQLKKAKYGVQEVGKGARPA
jgi:uncharacterized membrane protein YgdD (TMEM256/DUF423 family)